MNKQRLIIIFLIGMLSSFIIFYLIDVWAENDFVNSTLVDDDIYGYEWGMVTEDNKIIKKFIK